MESRMRGDSHVRFGSRAMVAMLALEFKFLIPSALSRDPLENLFNKLNHTYLSFIKEQEYCASTNQKIHLILKEIFEKMFFKREVFSFATKKKGKGFLGKIEKNHSIYNLLDTFYKIISNINNVHVKFLPLHLFPFYYKLDFYNKLDKDNKNLSFSERKRTNKLVTVEFNRKMPHFYILLIRKVNEYPILNKSEHKKQLYQIHQKPNNSLFSKSLDRFCKHNMTGSTCRTSWVKNRWIRFRPLTFASE